jgi:hypothetical protein
MFEAKKIVFLPTTPPEWGETIAPPNTLFV